ncbi:serine phosphatase RsbU (regulator of sigma subunit) [Hamadaea flava]|uniref:PP2C family protein-serine/threonine phosphatase n=1 Tax=Hamadaea flava TaxID=1742688 RepID=A0ABV8LLC5_9ACTN|nr:SpoIIE family protein phosphatase [Hamadaea flava]MCP2324492.1 serine phosphatase RsbU (regulator of sigma subunit) [Hamadaea flava]
MPGVETQSDALRSVEDLLAVQRPEGSGRSARHFAQQLLRLLLPRLATPGVSVEVDRADGRGAITLAAAGRPPGEPSAALRVPLELTPPWTGDILIAPNEPAETRTLCRLAAQRLGTVLEHERLREADLRRREWLTYLVEVGDLLAHSIDTTLTEALIPRLIVPRLGDWCALLTISGGRPQVAAVAHVEETAASNMLSPHHELGRRLTSDELAEAVETGATTALSDPPACLVVPLLAHGRLLGALAVGHATTPDAETVTIAEEVARRAATALDNAHVHDERSQVARILQEALLPGDLPKLPGVDIGARYLPTGHYAEVGGDMYDVIPLPGGGCLAVVCDVAGKGIQAASATGIVREVLRALIADGKPVGEALAGLNTTMHARSDRHCTLALAEIAPAGDDHGDRAVTVYLAGHDQPILVRADGAVASAGKWGTALGVVARVHCPPERLTLHPGDALVFFTDGLTERRSGREFFGLHRMLDAAAQLAGNPADVIADGLATMALNFSAEPVRDDITVVAIRNDG